MAEQDPRQLYLMLRHQFEMQVNDFKNDPRAMTREQRIDFLHWNTTALGSELHEMLGEIGWKPWASSKHINTEAALKEMIDAFHFFMNILLAIYCQMDEDMGTSTDIEEDTPLMADDFVMKYFNKAAVNKARQAEGYDGVSGKCTICRRDMKESALYLCGEPEGCPLK